MSVLIDQIISDQNKLILRMIDFSKDFTEFLISEEYVQLYLDFDSITDVDFMMY